jgi:AraC-like DNA-binding protein
MVTPEVAGQMVILGVARAPALLQNCSLPKVENVRVTAAIDELRRLRRARDRMDREYALALDVPALARTALMSPAHFSRRFREAYSETPYSYLMTRRIERAKALLRRGDLSVTDVCFAVGRASLGSFSARFTGLVGETPSAYRVCSHEELRAVPACQTMVMTRPRRGEDRGASAGMTSSEIR